MQNCSKQKTFSSFLFIFSRRFYRFEIICNVYGRQLIPLLGCSSCEKIIILFNVLFSDESCTELKEHLMENMNFHFLPEEAWQLLVEWYGMVGDQTEIKRKVNHWKKFCFCRNVHNASMCSARPTGWSSKYMPCTGHFWRTIPTDVDRSVSHQTEATALPTWRQSHWEKSQQGYEIM